MDTPPPLSGKSGGKSEPDKQLEELLAQQRKSKPGRKTTKKHQLPNTNTDGSAGPQPQQGGFGQPQQGGFGQPQQGGFGQPQQGGFGQPQQGGFGQPQQGGFGQPQQGGVGQPQQSGLGQPQQGGFAQPQQGGFGQPQQGGLGQPQQGGFGQPQQGGFAQPQQGGFAQPQQGGFAQPQQGGFAQSQQGGPVLPAQAGLGQPQQGGLGQPQQGGLGQPQQSGSAQPQQGFGQPQQGGFAQPQQGGFAQPQQGGFAQPQQGGFAQPQQGGFAQPQQGGFAQPQQGGFAQAQQGGAGPQARPPQGAPGMAQQANLGQSQQNPYGQSQPAYPQQTAPGQPQQGQAGSRPMPSPQPYQQPSPSQGPPSGTYPAHLPPAQNRPPVVGQPGAQSPQNQSTAQGASSSQQMQVPPQQLSGTTNGQFGQPIPTSQNQANQQAQDPGAAGVPGPRQSSKLGAPVQSGQFGPQGFQPTNQQAPSGQLPASSGQHSAYVPNNAQVRPQNIRPENVQAPTAASSAPDSLDPTIAKRKRTTRTTKKNRVTRAWKWGDETAEEEQEQMHSYGPLYGWSTDVSQEKLSPLVESIKNSGNDSVAPDSQMGKLIKSLSIKQVASELSELAPRVEPILEQHSDLFHELLELCRAGEKGKVPPESLTKMFEQMNRMFDANIQDTRKSLCFAGFVRAAARAQKNVSEESETRKTEHLLMKSHPDKAAEIMYNMVTAVRNGDLDVAVKAFRFDKQKLSKPVIFPRECLDLDKLPRAHEPKSSIYISTLYDLLIINALLQDSDPAARCVLRQGKFEVYRMIEQQDSRGNKRIAPSSTVTFPGVNYEDVQWINKQFAGIKPPTRAMQKPPSIGI